MEEKKRKVPKLVRLVLAVVTICIIYAIVYPFSYNMFKRDDLSIQSSYDTKKQKIELLKEISKDCINEGVGINIPKELSPILEEEKGYIDQESMSYEIYSKDENIIIYYRIKEPSERESRYNATITLSKDFKVLKEDYSIELEDLEDFETYKKQCKREDNMMIILASIWISVCTFIAGKMIINIFLDN